MQRQPACQADQLSGCSATRPVKPLQRPSCSCLLLFRVYHSSVPHSLRTAAHTGHKATNQELQKEKGQTLVKWPAAGKRHARGRKQTAGASALTPGSLREEGELGSDSHQREEREPTWVQGRSQGHQATTTRCPRGPGAERRLRAAHPDAGAQFKKAATPASLWY